MLKHTRQTVDPLKPQRGLSVPELIVVLLVVAIISVIALPQILSSTELFGFSGMQREMVSYLREAREQAIAQRKSITFRYDHDKKRVVLYGGRYGNLGDYSNFVAAFDGSDYDLDYGLPASVTATALADGTEMSPLSGDVIEITFRSDGSVLDAGDNPRDHALFFFHKKHQRSTAFAVSVLGAGGRIKLWRYSERVDAYIE